MYLLSEHRKLYNGTVLFMFKKFLAGGVLVPWPGIGPVTLQWKAESEPLDHQGGLCWFLSYTPAMKLSEKMTKNIQIHENVWDYLLFSHWGEKDHLRRNHESKHCFVPIFEEYNIEQPPSLFILVGRCQSNRRHMNQCILGQSERKVLLILSYNS